MYKALVLGLTIALVKPNTVGLGKTGVVGTVIEPVASTATELPTLSVLLSCAVITCPASIDCIV